MTATNKYKVASLGTAQKLLEAGIKLKTAFQYDIYGELYIEVPDEHETIYLGLKNKRCFRAGFRTFYPAPTLGDIWDALPKSITNKGSEYSLKYTLNGHEALVYKDEYGYSLPKVDEWTCAKFQTDPLGATTELLLLLKKDGLLPS